MASVGASAARRSHAQRTSPLARCSTCRLRPSLGTLTLHSFELLNRKRVGAGELRLRVKAMEAKCAAETTANLAALQDKHAHAQPADPPAVEVGMNLTCTSKKA